MTTPTTFTVAHIFCGIGGSALGARAASATHGTHTAQFRTIGGIDVDPLACRDFEMLLGAPALCADVHELQPADLRRFFGRRAPDVVMMSPPCLPGDEQVCTPTGERRIETLRSGDLVLTHRGRFRPVQHVGSKLYDGQIVQIRVQGSVDFRRFTSNHPIWRRRSIKGAELGPAEFVDASAIEPGDRVGWPVDREIPGTAKSFAGTTARAMWFLFGSYLGDGYRLHRGRAVAFCVGPRAGRKFPLVTMAIEACGLKWRASGTFENEKIVVYDHALYEACAAFGDLAANKYIPEEVLHVERDQLMALLMGYANADGTERTGCGSRSTRVTSISLRLLRGIQRLLLRLELVGCIRKQFDSQPWTIEGRAVQISDQWALEWRAGRQRQTHVFEDDTAWLRVKEVRSSTEQVRVWNLDVADDDTFCVPLIATHNCKGFSALLSAKRAAEPHYQRMNALMERALFLVISTWKTPPKLIFVENVPRITSRGRETIRRCLAMGHAAGYAIAQGNHDCGELGGLAQHRPRYFQLWRHRAQVPSCVYEPPTLRVRACGEVLGGLPMPGDVAAAGPMHSLPRLSWKNWVRLGLIPAGGDWRDLEGTLEHGEKRRAKFRRAPVTPWEAPAETVTGPGGSQASNVADPRFANILHVSDWDDPARTVIGATRPGSGAPSVADPSWSGRLGVNDWNEPSGTVAGGSLPNNGRFAVADPRPSKPAWQRVAGVTPWTEPAPTITAGAKIHAGAFQVADPRVQDWLSREEVRSWIEFGCTPRSGAYGVLSWQEAAATITGAMRVDNGFAAVADPRFDPDQKPPFVPMIIAADGTWHRPLTTLELAALQSLPLLVDGKPLVLAGKSHTRWRQAIGNLVPPDAARTIGDQLLNTLLLTSLGVAFSLGGTPVWVSPQAVVA